MTTSLPLIQEQALKNSRRWFPEVHATPDTEIVHQALGIAGEAGEVIELVKKMHRSGDFSDPQRISDLRHELADVLTYVCNLAEHYNIDLAQAFHEKQAICEERWG